MWLPVVVPYSFEPNLKIYDNRLGRTVHPTFPGNRAVNETVVSVNFVHACQGFCNDRPYNEEGRKFMLMRLLFDLIRVNHYLEITDPKLLGWYLSLPVEDRTLVQKEGGFMQFIQRHPALEVVRKIVYLKKQFRENYSAHPTSMSSNHNKSRYQVESSQCQNCGYSFQFGTKKCHRCGVHVLISDNKVYKSGNDEELELLPRNVREELDVLTTKNEFTPHSCESPDEEKLSAQAQCLSQLWEEVEQIKDLKHFKDPTAQANSSLDIELDMQSQARRINRIQNDQAQSYKEESEGASNYCDVSQENLPEYYSFSSTSLNHTEQSDGSQNTEASFNDSIMATKGSTESSETTITSPEDSGDCFSSLSNSFELANDSGHHLEDLREREREQQMEKKLPVGSLLKSTSSVQCGTPCTSFFVNQIVDASSDFRACFTSTRATEVCQTLQTKACRSVATDTDSLPVSNKKDTQTMQTSTSDKSTITEVYMADLNILTEEFIKLKQMEKELKQLKNRKSRPSPGGDLCGNVGGCDCAQRVRRAELRLLGLQFVMCQQHCLRRYFTSPLGESAHQGTEALPDILAETLDSLEKDYHEMKRQILAGTPLDDLKSLSVDSQKILTTGTYYSPSSVLDAHLGSFDCLGSASTNSHTLKEKPEGMRGPLCQNTEDILDEPIGNGSNRARMEGLFNKQPGMSSVIKDLNGSEAWFDAEEEFGSSNQDGNMEKQKEGRESMNHKMEQKETDENTFNQSSLLFVTCLPNNANKQEMMIWFEKYNATDVHIATFSNNIRGAVVYLKSPEDAKAAVKNLNGCTFQGQSVYLQQISGPTSTHPKPSDQPNSTAKISKAEVDKPKTKGVHYSLSPRGLRCSVDRLTKVCDSPTASGTFVPQRCVGKGSFNTIMTRLSERHPDIDRQKIVDALLELREMNQGMLSGYTLSAIVDMTSKRLTQGFSSKFV